MYFPQYISVKNKYILGKLCGEYFTLLLKKLAIKTIAKNIIIGAIKKYDLFSWRFKMQPNNV